jgi:5'-nucleotidase
MKPIILVTNDDGINSPGLKALAKAMKSLGEVYIIAPDRERSAVGHSLTLHHPLRMEKIDSHTFVVDGTPTDCVMLGILGFLKTKPHLVASGINRGPNLGDDITYSGTVSAAFEGTLLGVPSFAISLVNRRESNFNVGVEFAKKVGKEILRKGLPPDTLLNINIPAVTRKEIRGVQIVRQGKRIYKDQIIEKIDPRGRRYYWIGGAEPAYKKESRTDFYAIEHNYISITPIHLDLTNHKAMNQIKKWKLGL